MSGIFHGFRKQDNQQLSAVRSSLMREVAGLHPEAPPILFQFQLVADTSSGMDRILDEGLRWLIKNKLTGSNFIQWVKFENSNSVLFAAAKLRKIVQKDPEVQEIFADRH